MTPFEWSYPAGYPGGPDAEAFCVVCGKEPDHDCDCPECECGVVGEPGCYDRHWLKPAHDSIQSLIDHEGCGSTLRELFRAIERHSSPCYGLWIVLADGTKHGSPETRVAVDFRDPRHRRLIGDSLDAIPTYTRIARVGVSGIAWDGSDWEFYEEVAAGNRWTALDDLKEGFADALAEVTP